MSTLSRRDFLKLARDGFLALSSALTLGGLLRYLDFDANPAPRKEFDLGPAANYPLNSRTILAEPPAVVLHTEHGFSALSRVCTHLGCTLESNIQGFACPCHGSHFDANGNVRHRPADRPLEALRVKVTEQGNLKIFTS
jgi:cytochrome b6-f complex iron-sulfur subunit